MENGYDCTVNVVSGDTTPTFTSMNEKGQPDMAPEMWVNTLGTPTRKPSRAAISFRKSKS